MMIKEGFTKISNSMTPRARTLVLGRGHIFHIVNMDNFIHSMMGLLTIKSHGTLVCCFSVIYAHSAKSN